MNDHNITLFCLPFSGGNRYSYRTLEAYLDQCIHPITVELPGHGQRLREPLLTDVHVMVEDIFHQISESFTTPYAIYGHSMGTILGYLVTVKIFKEALPLPVHLFVSGHGSPSVKFQEEPIHLLPDQEFVQKVMEYGGIPQEVAVEKDLMALFTPIMKADFQALYDYVYADANVLDIPLTILIGTDEGITHDDAFAWQKLTSRAIMFKEFSGGHFFVFEHLQEIGQLISDTLSKYK